MTATLTTLSPVDRILVSLPSNRFDISVERVGNETVVRVLSFNGVRILRATPISDTCADVRVENFPRIGGRCDRLGRVIEFTTSNDFVEGWVNAALS